MNSLIYIDIDREQARDKAGSTVMPAINIALLTPWRVSLHFHHNGSTAAVDMSSADFKLVLKLTPTSEVLLYDDQATMDEAGRAVIETTMDSSTLRTVLGNAVSIQATTEVEWIIGGKQGRVTWPVTIRNAFVRPGDEGPPPAGNASETWLSARGVRFDLAQFLSAPQRQQARDNLGLGDSATQDVGTSAGTVCAGNDSRLSDARTPSGGAGGVLSGNYPNPGFAVNMATQEELDSALATKADLVGGLIPSSQIPQIAITQYKGAAASQAAMLLLTGEPGDFCFRTDQGVAYFITSGDGSQVSHWQAVATPASVGVVSVNGNVGIVVLNAAGVGAPPTSRSILTTQSIIGGGDFSSNRTLSLVGDSFSPGSYRVYGTNSIGTKGWQRGAFDTQELLLRGHTDGGTADQPPANLTVTVTSFGTATFDLSVNNGGGLLDAHFTISYEDPSNGTIFVNIAALSTVQEIAFELWNAVQAWLGANLPGGSASLDDVTITISNLAVGASAFLGYGYSGFLSVEGGGSGSDAIPPSGGIHNLSIYSQPCSVIAAYWWSSGGSMSDVEIYEDITGEVLATISSPTAGSGGKLLPMTALQAQKFASSANLSARLADSMQIYGDCSLRLILI